MTPLTGRAEGQRSTPSGFWRRHRGWLVPVLGVTAVLHAIFIVSSSRVIAGRRIFILFDDAAISMRYAENIAGGHGPVWNPGQTPVEAITNPLWTAWMSLVHLLGFSDATAGLPVMITSSALLLGCVLLAARITHQVAPDLDYAPPMAAVLTALTYPLLYWSLRGMEVGAVACGLLAAVTLVLDSTDTGARQRRLWPLVAVLVAMLATRLDTAVLITVVLAWLVGSSPPARRGRILGVVGGWLAAAILAMTAARLAYYGELVPNTYFLKSSGISLSTRLDAGALTLAKMVLATLVMPLAAAAAGVAHLLDQRRRRDVALLVGALLAQTGYNVWIGGDAWEFVGYANRYISTVLPLLAVLGGIGVAVLAHHRRPSTLALAAGLAGLGSLAFAAWGDGIPSRTAGVFDWGPWRGPLVGLGIALVGLAAGAMIRARRRHRPHPTRTGPATLAIALALTAAVSVAANGHAMLKWHHKGPEYLGPDAGWVRDGLTIEACTDPDTTVAVFAAGQIIYYSERTGIDLLGKADPVVARTAPEPDRPFRPGHTKLEYAYSVGELRPDIVTGTGYAIPPELARRAGRWGYEIIGGWMVRQAATGIDRRGLLRSLLAGEPRCGAGP